MRVVGSGLGRTGTASLKAALESLLGGACYHMFECFGHPDHPAQWHAGIRGEAVDWDSLLDGYAAAVDWPAAACWKELAVQYPDAVILHSERPADEWFRSADATIFEGLKKPLSPSDVRGGPWMDMAKAMLTERFTPDYLDREAAIAAFDAWNADVRATAPAAGGLEVHGALHDPLGGPPSPRASRSVEGFNCRACGLVTRRAGDGTVGRVDEGLPIAYEVLGPGVPVYAPDGDQVGTVDHVLSAPAEDIFHGIVIRAEGVQRFIAAEQVASLHERGVDLRIDAAATAALPEHHGGARALHVREPGVKPSRWIHIVDLLSGKDPRQRDWREEN
jgi:hypothetical protein